MSQPTPVITHTSTAGAHTRVQTREGESLLDALLRQGADITFSCKGGSCHACLVHSPVGEIPAAAQRGLPDTLAHARFLLACQCQPRTDMSVRSPSADEVRAARTPRPMPAAEQPLPPTDPALWHELDEGRTVRAVLEDFYTTVYADPLLSPYFEHVTQERVTGQQYAFLRLLMTGEKLYFGERPRNAHHWMVISDELLNHRQALMEAALRRAGLSDDQIWRWTELEEHWRVDMVKTAPIAKVQFGQTFALEGFDREVLTSGSLCDHCGTEVPEGTEVLYHRRLGTISCPACAQREGQAG